MKDEFEGIEIDDAEVEKLVKEAEDRRKKQAEEQQAAQVITFNGIFEMTEAGNRERFIKDWQGELKFVKNLKSWYDYKDGHWGECTDVINYAIITARQIKNEADNIKGVNQDEKDALRILKDQLKAWGKASESTARLNAMLSLSAGCSEFVIESSAFNKHIYLLNCLNGTINLQTGNLLPHNPTDMISKTVHLNYNPSATCPIWDKFLERVQPEAEMRDFLNRLFGWCLTGDTSENRFLFHWGEGGNGKTIFAETLKLVLGNDFATQGRAELFTVNRNNNTDFETANFEGKRYIRLSEITSRAKLNEAKLKDFCGGESIFVERKGVQGYNFKPQGKLILHGNHKPEIGDSDKGIWRRVLMIPWLEEITAGEMDLKFADKLIPEYEGILAKGVKGCTDWFSQGLQPPETVIATTNEYKQNENKLAIFIEDCCDSNVEKLKENRADLWKAYVKWGEQTGEQYYTSANYFYKKLEELKYKPVKIMGKRYIKGIKLKDSDYNDDEPETLNSINEYNDPAIENPLTIEDDDPEIDGWY